MSATDINDWPGHPDADPDCECCLGDGLQADGETPCPCIDARKGEDLTFETEMPRAWLDVMGERVRQITAEGWTADHDDAHSLGQMAGAALCYLAEDIPHWARQQAHGCYWPWDAEWWKPGDHRRNLVKAGALILAEIERLDRATTESSHGE